MKKLVLALCATGAVALATPAYAAPTTCGSVTTPDFTITSAPGGSSAQACVGYYDGNLLNTNNETQQQQAIAALLQTSAGQASGITTPTSIDWDALVKAGVTYDGKAQNVTGNTFNFGTTLYGETIIGFHFGNGLPDKADPYNSASAFYLFDFGTTGATGLTFSPTANGFSNAAIYATGGRPSVPESATWAMMLLGFGGMGFTMRRRRNPAIAQLA